MQKIVRKKDLPSMIGLGRTAIEAAIAREDFPKPVRLGKRAVGFVVSEIDEWITRRAAERDGAK